MTQGGVLFPRLAIVGLGLIGSSIARAAGAGGLAGQIAGYDESAEVRAAAAGLGFLDELAGSAAEAAAGADLVILSVPIGASGAAARAVAPALKPGAIVTDTGSVKGAVVRDVLAELPPHAVFVPGHPIAGTEHSGPAAGFAELFRGRWCILTPPPSAPAEAVERVAALWRGMGSMIETMTPEHHDRVLAITSHLPHLIAYTIVGTATDLEDHLKQEVIKFSASGFRDFTRIAASDPIMWRDVFLNNREAVLDVIQRFTEDLTALQRAIRWGEADKLQDLFARTRAIRRSIIEARQA